MIGAGEQLAALSEWIDKGNQQRDPESILWGRIAKIGEEHGEVIAALIGMTGQNPRKGITHSKHDVIEELLDVAITALGAVEHMTGNQATWIELLTDKIDRVAKRAGV